MSKSKIGGVAGSGKRDNVVTVNKKNAFWVSFSKKVDYSNSTFPINVAHGNVHSWVVLMCDIVQVKRLHMYIVHPQYPKKGQISLSLTLPLITCYLF